MNNAFFSDLLASISERGRTLLRRAGSSNGKQDTSDLVELCEALLSGRGEASGTAMAREVLDRYHHLDDASRLSFFETLVRNYGPDRQRIAQAIETWRAQSTDEDASDLHFASEPRRQELIRRLNRAPSGTSELVSMRADLLDLTNGHKDLAALGQRERARVRVVLQVIFSISGHTRCRFGAGRQCDWRRRLDHPQRPHAADI